MLEQASECTHWAVCGCHLELWFLTWLNRKAQKKALRNSVLTAVASLRMQYTLSTSVHCATAQGQAASLKSVDTLQPGCHLLQGPEKAPPLHHDCRGRHCCSCWNSAAASPHCLPLSPCLYGHPAPAPHAQRSPLPVSQVHLTLILYKRAAQIPRRQQTLEARVLPSWEQQLPSMQVMTGSPAHTRL